MHDTDTRVEDRLRAALRAEADDLPFTVTVDRLERRLAERGRSARATRLAGSLAAAAVVVVAVGIAAYAVVNRDTGPAATPLPSATLASPSLAPTVGPSTPASPGPSVSASPSTAPAPTPVAPTGVAYACGAARFDAALLSTVGTAERVERPDAAAIREELAHPSLDQAVLPASGYWLVDEAPGRSLYLGAPLGVAEQYVVLDVSEQGGRWAVRSATDCRPSVVVDGAVGEATWTWDQAAPAPDTTTTTFTALVSEYRCSSGQPAAGRVRGPQVVVQPDRVLVGFAVEPLSGDQDCQAADPTPVTVTLPEPLGDRPLVDAGSYPFADRRPEIVVPPTPLADLPAPTLPAKLEGVTKVLGASGTSESARLIRSVAIPADTDRYYVRLGCTGSGTIALIVDGIGDDVPCDAAGLSEFSRDADDSLDFSLETEGVLRYTVAVDARDIDAGPGFHAPALTMTGPDYTAGDIVSVRGFDGCGLSYRPKGGSGSVTDCGPSWQPMATFLHQRPGTAVSLTLADGWAITRIAGWYADQDRILPSGRDPVRTPWFGADADLAPVSPNEQGEVAVPVPPVGGWGLVIYVTATKDGAEFTLPYYFRVTVEP